MSSNLQESPRVFISYSHTSAEHADWVRGLAERLMADGIDVELDQWALREGHDLNAFMERMVADPSIQRVIIVSDKRYKEKADARKGGVGTESQIISHEVYAKVDQEKFIAIFTETNEDGTPCLPVFFRSRKSINFTENDNHESYEQLIRTIYERPLRSKPALGKPPAHIFVEEAVRLPSIQKSKRFVEVITSGKGNAAVAFESFTEEFVSDYETLRMAYSNEQRDTWCTSISENIETARAHRNALIATIRAGAVGSNPEWLESQLLPFLERLLPFRNPPQSSGTRYEISEDNYKFLNYEIFLYVIALLVKARKYHGVRQLLEHTYVTADCPGGIKLESYSFAQFNEHARSLEDLCARQGGHNRYSVMADLLYNRADRQEATYTDLAQADVICSIVACGVSQYSGWFPRSLIYGSRFGKLELFARSTSENGFQPLKVMLGFKTVREMIEYIQSERMARVWTGQKLWDTFDADSALNLSNLKKSSGIT